MEKEFDIVAIGTMAYDMILRTVDETAFTRDTTVLESVGISSGGGAMTSVIAAQRVGCKTALVGRVCKDAFSSYLLQVLDEAGVDRSQVSQGENDEMSLTYALVRPDGNRHFLGRPGTNNRNLTMDTFDLDIVRRAKIVSYGSYFVLPGLDGEGIRRIFTEAKQAGAITVADVANDSFHLGRETVLQDLPLIDYFIPSYVEAEYLTGEQDVEKMARYLLSRGAKNVLIKIGEEGCYVANEHLAQTVPAFHVKACDTTGAGDNFVGGFMAGLADGMELLDAVRFGNAVAAVSVTGMGAVSALRDRKQVMELIESSRS
ncbi:MAG: carbohydrate kinase family protein [Oscillospiraceae bacterium]|nr:carbohydrate kinase family protein [Oscillospiraceae bacterium]